MPDRRGLFWLCLIVATGFAIRLFYLLQVTSQPGFQWDDPDSYMHQGLELAGGEEGWRFSFDAVRHSVEGRHYALPPLYPVFLSLFALFPGFPLNAQVGQAVLATLGVVLVFALARRIHSDGAGLVAASISALWLPNVIAVWSTMQEALYVPLVLLGFVLLLRAARDESAWWTLLLTGVVFGLAALTRSMAMYFLPFAAALLVGRPARKSATRIAGLLLGFALATVPYSVALSRHLGEPTFIENHGGLRVVGRYGGGPGDRPPGPVQTAEALARGFLSAPGSFLQSWWDTAKSLLQVNGGRLLQIYLGAATRTGALAAKLAAHAFADFALVAVLLLAPLGCLLCRQPHLAAFLVAWILLNFGLTGLSGFGGPRLRAPFEPQLIALAAVPLAGRYRPASPLGWLAALIASSALAIIVLPQLPASLRARADYGVDWPLEAPPKRSAMIGEAGFNLAAVDGAIEFAARPRNAGRPTRVEVWLDSERAEPVVIVGQGEREHLFHYEWARSGRVYVEIIARDAAREYPVKMLVIVPSR